MDPENPTPDPAAAELAALKEQLVNTAAAVLAGVPENLRALIPANLPPADQLAWFHKAKATGVFDKPAAPAVPTTDAGKPTITPLTADLASLPVYARMAAGYRK